MVRRKQRYLLCEVVLENGNSLNCDSAGYMLSKIIKKTIQLLYGDYGAAVSYSIVVKYFKAETNMVMVRTARVCHQMVQSAMSFVKEIGDQKGFFRTLHIGGTIRSCQKFLIKYHRKQISHTLQQCKTDEERTKVQEALIAACAKMENIESEDFSIDKIMGENC